MKAAALHALRAARGTGPPGPARVPTPGKGQVLVTVKACGVNFPDVLMIQDKYQFKPALPFPPGGEVAGIVKELVKA